MIMIHRYAWSKLPVYPQWYNLYKQFSTTHNATQFINKQHHDKPQQVNPNALPVTPLFNDTSSSLSNPTKDYIDITSTNSTNNNNKSNTYKTSQDDKIRTVRRNMLRRQQAEALAKATTPADDYNNSPTDDITTNIYESEYNIFEPGMDDQLDDNSTGNYQQLGGESDALLTAYESINNRLNPMNQLQDMYLNPQQMLRKHQNKSSDQVDDVDKQQMDELAQQIVAMSDLPMLDTLHHIQQHQLTSTTDFALYFLYKPITIDNINELINICSVQHKYTDGMIAYNNIKHYNLPCNVYTYIAMYKLCVSDIYDRSGRECNNIQKLTNYERYQSVMTLHNEFIMNHSGELSIEYYGQLIHSICLFNQYKSIELLLGEMKSYHIQPNQVLYTSIINTYLNNKQYDKCYALHEEFHQLTRGSTQHDIIYYNTYMNVCAHANQTEKMINIFNEACNIGLHPTLHTYSILINGCSQRNDFYVQAFQYYQQLQQMNYQPNEYIYNSLLYCCAQNGDINNVILLMKEMKLNNIERDTISYSTALMAIAKSMKHRYIKLNSMMLDQNDRLLMSDKLWTQCTAQPNIIIDTQLLYCYISCYARAMRLRTTELKLVQLIQKYNLTLNINLYNLLLRMYSRARRLNDINRLVDVVATEYNIQLNQQSYHIILHACIKCRDTINGSKYLNEMRSAGYEPDSKISSLFDTGMLTADLMKHSVKKINNTSIWQLSRGDGILGLYKNKRGDGRRQAKYNINPDIYNSQKYKKSLDEYYGDVRQRQKHGY